MQMHIFKYSIREGTAAEKLPDRIRGEIKEDRSRQMIELAENMKEKFYRKYEGKIVSNTGRAGKRSWYISWNCPESHGRVNSIVLPTT